jgi:hypothetical protein
VRRPLHLCTLLFCLFAVPAAAKDYSAERFDSHVEVLRGGTLQVTETVRLRFEDGTFTEFFREIPARRTDGIDIISTTMDGNALTPGEGPGHVEIRSGSGVRVTWHFAPASGSSHTFVLTYVVRGAVRRDGDADVLAWRALPGQHAYRIDAGTIEFNFPTVPTGEPEIKTHKGTFTPEVAGALLRIAASRVRANGWVEAHVRLPRGSVIDSPPGWQQRALDIRGRSGTWIALGSVVLLAGLAVLFGVRQGYDPPPSDDSAATPSAALPERLAPAIAGALLTNGSSQIEHAMATLFALAERGELAIEEQPRSLGQANFVVRRASTRAVPAPHERVLLELMFGTAPGSDNGISLGKARGRLTRHFRRFRAAVRDEMAAAGLLDTGRAAVRRRFRAVALASFAGAAAFGVVAAVFLTDQFGPWPMLIPLASVVTGVAALISYAAHTPLSNDAVRRLRSWRGFRARLAQVAKERSVPTSAASTRSWLPYAVAAGLAPAWAKYMKQHQGLAPAWFHALGSADRASSFSTFVATGGAGDGSHAGGAGSAAGGGASGAR